MRLSLIRFLSSSVDFGLMWFRTALKISSCSLFVHVPVIWCVQCACLRWLSVLMRGRWWWRQRWQQKMHLMLFVCNFLHIYSFFLHGFDSVSRIDSSPLTDIACIIYGNRSTRGKALYIHQNVVGAKSNVEYAATFSKSRPSKIADNLPQSTVGM